jgi:hypothetical protein
MSVTRHERVLCIGQNYAGTSLRLQGCHADATAYFQFFCSRLTTKNPQTFLWKDTPVLLTKEGVLRALDWLLSGATVQQLLNPSIKSFEKWPIPAYTNIYFACAGHGTTIKGRVDAGDQSLVTSNGNVTDDEINDLLFARMKSTTKFMGCVDCCSSGTIADLKYVLKNGVVTEDKNHNTGRNIQGVVQFFSACQDYKYAGEVDSGGLFTRLMLKNLETPRLPLTQLINNVNESLKIWGQVANVTCNKNPLTHNSIL